MLEISLLILVLVCNGLLFVIWKSSNWVNILVRLVLFTIVILDVLVLYKNFGG